MKYRHKCTIYMGTFKTQKMAQIRATSCSAVFQVFKRRASPPAGGYIAASADFGSLS
jgi:hypothetical protein